VVPTEDRSYLRSLEKSDVHVLRGLQSLGNNSQVGGMITSRDYGVGGTGMIYSADASFRLTSTLSWIGQLVESTTVEPEGIEINPGETFADGKHTVDLDGEKYNGTAFITELRRNAEHWNFVLDYNQVSPTYRTQTGYDPWNDQRNGFVWTTYNFNFDEGLIERITPGVFFNGRWNYDGERKWYHANPSLNVRLRWAQTNLGVHYSAGSENWGGVEFADLWSWGVDIHSRPSDRIGYFARINVSEDPALFTLTRGDQKQVSLALDIKPVDNLMYRFHYFRWREIYNMIPPGRKKSEIERMEDFARKRNMYLFGTTDPVRVKWRYIRQMSRILVKYDKNKYGDYPQIVKDEINNNRERFKVIYKDDAPYFREDTEDKELLNYVPDKEDLNWNIDDFLTRLNEENVRLWFHE